jgi:hypothetical protein
MAKLHGGDMESVARAMTRESRGARSATGGKNLQSRARRKGKQVPDGKIGGMTGKPLAGPDRGTG